MTAKNTKSINRDDIKLFILPKFYELPPEIVYLNDLYYYDELDQIWLKDDLLYRTDEATLANRIDLLLYSNYIDSFIEYYNL